MSLDIGPRYLDRTCYERLDRIGNVVRLVEHIRRIKSRRIAQFGVDQFVKDKEQLKWFYRTGVKIIIAIFAVIEMKTAELSELDKTRHDLFNIYVWSVMAKVDETRRLFAQLFRANIARSPVVYYRRVKCRFVKLMFDK